MTLPRPARDNRLLVIDRASGAWRGAAAAGLPELLEPGDLLVVNDAATLPASLAGRLRGEPVELRLAEAPDADGAAWAVLFGPRSWRDDTDLRLAPPIPEPGERIALARGAAEVLEGSPISPRLVRIALEPGVIWEHGAPVQYSYLERPLHLAEVQTSYAGRPWAVEMPSAGRPLDQALRDRLAGHGVGVVALTHGAGLSATGEMACAWDLPPCNHQLGVALGLDGDWVVLPEPLALHGSVPSATSIDWGEHDGERVSEVRVSYLDAFADNVGGEEEGVSFASLVFDASEIGDRATAEVLFASGEGGRVYRRSTPTSSTVTSSTRPSSSRRWARASSTCSSGWTSARPRPPGRSSASRRRSSPASTTSPPPGARTASPSRAAGACSSGSPAPRRASVAPTRTSSRSAGPGTGRRSSPRARGRWTAPPGPRT